ncbi:MAG: hypothetical protein EX271_13695 [Acidimicrobiales bacterium]|nr:hypothetical protein [Hyphomonadaceae bacterium]RZV34261.1 MAG: hypothetical protein EX271_13695 [Acidimicrobiales bacterium]
MKDITIDEKVRKQVTPELRKGEVLLWADRPNRLPISMSSIFLMLFSFIWLSVVLLIILGVFTSIQVAETEIIPPGLVTELAKPIIALAFYVPFFFLLIGLMLLLSSVRLLISPLFQVYALTDQRGIIASNLFPRRIISITSHGFERIERTGNDDIGTLEIASRQNRRDLRTAMYQVQLDSFQKIKKPKAVERLIHEQFLSGGAG